MMNHHTTQQHSTNQSQRHLVNSASYPFDSSAQAALLAHYWSCTGCGTAHVRVLPEECINCGATALEFKYMVPGEMGS